VANLVTMPVTALKETKEETRDQGQRTITEDPQEEADLQEIEGGQGQTMDHMTQETEGIEEMVEETEMIEVVMTEEIEETVGIDLREIILYHPEAVEVTAVTIRDRDLTQDNHKINHQEIEITMDNQRMVKKGQFKKTTDLKMMITKMVLKNSHIMSLFQEMGVAKFKIKKSPNKKINPS
jgi:hypothetical protein